MTITTPEARPPVHARRRGLIATIAFVVAVCGIGLALMVFNGRPLPTTAIEQAIEEMPTSPKRETGGREVEIVRLSPEVVKKYGVRIGAAKKKRLIATIAAPARVAYNGEAMAIIGAAIQGRAIEVKARTGETVEKNAALLVVESAELGEAQSDFLQKHTGAVTARSMMGPATSIYNRSKKLYDDSQGIRLAELQKREVDLRQAEGALANAEAASAAAKNKLQLLGMSQPEIDQLLASGIVSPRYIVRSPIAGQVVERSVNLGELVKPEREKLFVVADTKTLWIWADVPESRAREVAEGATARIRLTTGGADSLAAATGETFAGVVSHIAPSIDPETRSLRARIDVDWNAALRPGGFVLVEIGGKHGGDHAEPLLAVPESAIQMIDGRAAVFLPAEDETNVFTPRPVNMGDCIDGQVCILSGLKEGDRVVVSGSAILKADLLKASAKDED